MSDLSTMMNVAPLNASFMMGQNNAQDQQTAAMKQMELQQLMEQRAQQEARLQGREPLELERLGLANQSTASQIPGQAATSRKLGVDANIAEQTQGSNVDAKNFDNNNGMVTKVGQQLGAMVGDLSGVPDIEKPSRVRDAISQLGLPQGAAARLWQKISQVSPGQMGEEIKKISDAMLRATPAYAQQMDSTNMTNDMHIVRGAAQDASNERVAQIGADSRVTAAIQRASARHQSAEEAIATAKTALERYQKLNDAATVAAQNQEPEVAQKYRDRARAIEPQAIEELKRNPAAGAVSVGSATGLAVNPPPNIAPTGRGAIPGGLAPAGSAQAGRVTVIDKNGQRGSVPAAQLEQALKQGYTKAQ